MDKARTISNVKMCKLYNFFLFVFNINKNSNPKVMEKLETVIERHEKVIEKLETERINKIK